MKIATFRRIVPMLSLLLLAAACRTTPAGEARFTRFAYAGHDARFERSIDPRNAYLNPVLCGFNSDPSVCRKGVDYFLVTSSFTFHPSIPIYHSRDLVHWRSIGSVIVRPERLPLDSLRFNRGVYAADISYNPHNDTFYVVNTCVDGIGNFAVKCRDPFAGDWSDPIPLPEAEGIDPSLFFDDDGRAYLCHNGMPPGGRQWNSHRALWMREYDLDRDCLTGDPVLLLDGGLDPASRPEWLEGPRIYKTEGRYYLLAAEGGTYENHAQIALVADAVTGPYRPCAVNPVLTQRDLPEDRPDKVTCAGHADLIDTPEGDWYAVFHGCRPYADTHYNTGRETFLLPVERSRFPVILPPGEAIPTAVRKPGLQPDGQPPQSGNFSWETDFREPLDGRWLWIRTPRSRWWRTGEEGLALHDSGCTLFGQGSPAFVGCRQQHTDFEAETELRFRPQEGAFAGMALFQNERHNLLFGKSRRGGRTEIVVIRTEKRPEILCRLPIADNEKPVVLRIRAAGGRCDLEYAEAGKPFATAAAGVDCRNLSTHTARGFNGVLIGLYNGKAATETNNE